MNMLKATGMLLILAGVAVAQGTSKPITFAMKNGKGESIGTATVTGGGNASKISLAVKGLSQGTHAIHVHNVAKCDGPDFTSAGPHADSGSHKHGKDNPQGPHSGDMDNFEVSADGTSTATVNSTMPLSAITEKSLVIHEKADDYKTDPSGNSGARIACGVAQE
jgi:Cu-Zn family superoxide dismutase